MRRERLYEAVPKFLCDSFGPMLRRNATGDRAFLARASQTHGEAMLSRSEDHWQRLVRTLRLVGYEAILDLGCGSGAWLRALASLNGSVAAVDVDVRALETARKRTSGVRNVVVSRMAAESLAFTGDSFDAVTCLTVLPYLDHDPALKEVSRVLRTGGRLVVGTVGSGYYAKHVVEGIRHDDPRAVRYGLDPIAVGAARAMAGDKIAANSIRSWSPRSVSRLLKQRGFRVDSVMRSVDPVEPGWPTQFLGRPVYFLTFAINEFDVGHRS